MDYQPYQVILSPDLELTPAAFADAWNETPESHDIAEAHLSTAKGTQFDPAMVATILLSIPINMASNALYDLVKKVIQQARDRQGAHSHPHPHKHIHIEQREKPGGTPYPLIDIVEK